MSASASFAMPIYQGVAKSSSGYKLLQAMGWKEGDGLGASNQGIKEHVKVKKKFDALGVGAAEKAQTLRDWTTGMVNFDRILSGLKEVTAKRNDDDDADNATGSSSSSEDEKPVAKAKKSKKAKKTSSKEKKKRSKKAATPSSSSSSSSSDSDSETDEDEKERIKRVKLATHVGRYQKRERAKHVKNYSTSDLAAILGAGPSSNEAGPLEVRAVHREDSSSSEEEGEEALRPSTPTPQEDVGMNTVEDGDKPAETGWWVNYFVRAGRIGSMRAALKAQVTNDGKNKITVHGFSEQDQEALYEQAQNGAAHGKQGLGRSDMPKKVAGARWSGKKTKIGSDDEEEEEASGSGEVSEEEDEEAQLKAGKAVIVMSKNEQKCAVVSEGKSEGVGKVSRKKGKDENEGGKNGTKVNWKKAAKRILKKQPKLKMKLKKLLKEITREAGCEADMEQMVKKLKRSDSFTINESTVKFVSS